MAGNLFDTRCGGSFITQSRSKGNIEIIYTTFVVIKSPAPYNSEVGGHAQPTITRINKETRLQLSSQKTLLTPISG